MGARACRKPPQRRQIETAAIIPPCTFPAYALYKKRKSATMPYPSHGSLVQNCHRTLPPTMAPLCKGSCLPHGRLRDCLLDFRFTIFHPDCPCDIIANTKFSTALRPRLSTKRYVSLYAPRYAMRSGCFRTLPASQSGHTAQKSVPEKSRRRILFPRGK